MLYLSPSPIFLLWSPYSYISSPFLNPHKFNSTRSLITSLMEATTLCSLSFEKNTYLLSNIKPFEKSFQYWVLNASIWDVFSLFFSCECFDLDCIFGSNLYFCSCSCGFWVCFCSSFLCCCSILFFVFVLLFDFCSLIVCCSSFFVLRFWVVLRFFSSI